MKKFVVFFIGVFITASAYAGQYADALNKCIASSVTDKDKANLARWALAAIGQHPEMVGIVSISLEKREEINRAFGLLNNRLLGETCAKELRDTVQFEGKAGASSSFEFFGRLAMQEVMANQMVLEGLSGAAKYLDMAKINSAINSR